MTKVKSFSFVLSETTSVSKRLVQTANVLKKTWMSQANQENIQKEVPQQNFWLFSTVVNCCLLMDKTLFFVWRKKKLTKTFWRSHLISKTSIVYHWAKTKVDKAGIMPALSTLKMTKLAYASFVNYKAGIVTHHPPLLGKISLHLLFFVTNKEKSFFSNTS